MENGATRKLGQSAAASASSASRALCRSGGDSEEGRSISFTCGEGAQTLRVEDGDRNRLIGVPLLMSYDDFRRRTPGE